MILALLAAVLLSQVPVVITAPGAYEFAETLTYSAPTGAAVIVASDDVTIDLAGYALLGTAGTGSLATGIQSVGRRNVLVTGGVVRGFAFGIRLDDGSGLQVEDIRVANNWYIGVWLDGLGALVQRVHVTNTGGSTVSGYIIPIAVKILGPGSVVRDSVITNLIGGTEQVGIAISQAPGGVIERNALAMRDPTGESSYGVWANDGSVSVLDNRFSRWCVAVVGAAPSPAPLKMRGNVFHEVGTVFSGAVLDLGGNQ